MAGSIVKGDLRVERNLKTRRASYESFTTSATATTLDVSSPYQIIVQGTAPAFFKDINLPELSTSVDADFTTGSEFRITNEMPATFPTSLRNTLRIFTPLPLMDPALPAIGTLAPGESAIVFCRDAALPLTQLPWEISLLGGRGAPQFRSFEVSDWQDSGVTSDFYTISEFVNPNKDNQPIVNTLIREGVNTFFPVLVDYTFSLSQITLTVTKVPDARFRGAIEIL